MISSIERYETRRSRHVRPICKVLGIPVPLPETDNPLLQRLYLGCRLLSDSDEDLQVVLVVVERLLDFRGQRKL